MNSIIFRSDYPEEDDQSIYQSADTSFNETTNSSSQDDFWRETESPSRTSGPPEPLQQPSQSVVHELSVPQPAAAAADLDPVNNSCTNVYLPSRRTAGTPSSTSPNTSRWSSRSGDEWRRREEVDDDDMAVMTTTLSYKLNTSI